jgi:signal transduction histidine kinase
MLPTPQNVDLIELAEAVLRFHYRRISAQKIHLVRDFPESVFAEIYAGEILQVISNLLSNSLDALPESGTISLRMRKYPSQIQLLLADSQPQPPPYAVFRRGLQVKTAFIEKLSGLLPCLDLLDCGVS